MIQIIPTLFFMPNFDKYYSKKHLIKVILGGDFYHLKEGK